MRIEVDADALCLRPGQILKVRDGKGAIIRVQRGLVWITQKNNPMDILLRPGLPFKLSGKRLAIVAFEPVYLSLEGPSKETL